MKKTRKAFEKHLNQLYKDSYSESRAIDNFLYLGTFDTIRRNFNNGTLGSLIRKKDPILFSVEYSEWLSKK